MPLPQLNVYRHDSRKQSLITLAGEIDLETAPLVRESLEQCLRDGIRTIDLTAVTFCDCSGLNAFLHASQQTAAAGGALQLHYPTLLVARLVDLTDSGFLFLDPPLGSLPAPLGKGLTPSVPALPRQLAPIVPALSGGVL
ncbi:STAS domain-containing protein [Streptomyces sp. CA-135486]|uniref:STAS domain-containing protein n=1 Tax=Streptomyces sp. CA-135486 TaxID=3240049 RepID=UPI003D8A7B57